MSLRLRTEAVGLAVAVAMLSGVAVLDYSTTEALVQTGVRVEQSRQLLEALDETLLATTAAGRQRRTYALSHEPADLAKIAPSIAEARSAFARARSLTDDSDQRGRLDELEPMLQRRFRDIDEAVAAMDRDGVTAVTEDALSRQGNMMMRQIAAQIDALRQDEQQRLRARQEGASHKADVAKAAGAIGTALSLAILVLVFGRLRTENARRRAAQQAADRATAFLDSIVEHIPDMIFVKDARELRFERINRAGEAMLGKSREDLVGKDDFAFFPDDQARFFQSKDRETLERRTVVDIAEEPIETPGGRRWLHTKKVPLLGEDGAPRFLLGISEDITERKQNAEALRAARDAAESANRELESFSYSVAHDLRAPLRGIDGFSQALLEDCGDRLDERGHEHLQRVRAAAQRMGDLIDSLLAVARLARAELRYESVDLSAVAAAVVDDLRRASPGRDVTVTIEPGLVARGDPRLLRVVLDNLLDNAFKFTARREHAHIAFGSEVEKGGERTFYVRDDGAGFDPRYAGNLFRVFQRLHDAHEFPGTGIGLATVQRVIQRHGGRIWAEGAPDRGATFFFTLRSAA